MKKLTFNPKFLVKPFKNGRLYPCFGTSFDITTVFCQRVINLEDYRQGICDMTEDKAEELRHHQPVFYLQQQADAFTDNGDGARLRHRWNGLLLFSKRDKKWTRITVMENRKEWNVVLSFEDPDKDRYWFVVDTKETSFDEETFWCDRARWKAKLDEDLDSVTAYDYSYYVRALMPEHYDIVDREVLFGEYI